MNINLIKTSILLLTLIAVSWKVTASNEPNRTEKVFASAIAMPVTPKQKEIISLHFENKMQNALLTLCNNTGEVVKTITNINGLDIIIDKTELDLLDNKVFYFTLSSKKTIVIGKLLVE